MRKIQLEIDDSSANPTPIDSRKDPRKILAMTMRSGEVLMKQSFTAWSLIIDTDCIVFASEE